MYTTTPDLARLRHSERLHEAAAERLRSAARSLRPRARSRRSRALDHHLFELAASPLFAGLSVEELRGIAQAADRFQAPAGATLSRGDAPTAQFVVLTAGVARAGNTYLGAGDHFGELTVLEGEPQVPTVQAVTAVRGYAFSRRGFWDAVGQAPTVALRIASALGDRMAQSDLVPSGHPTDEPLSVPGDVSFPIPCASNVSSPELA